MGLGFPVIVLCGGVGSRLRPLTASRQKCCLPIGGNAFVTHLDWALEKLGFQLRFYAAGYRSQDVVNAIASHAVVHDVGLLGTRAAVKSIMQTYNFDRSIVLNGDTLVQLGRATEIITRNASKQNYLIFGDKLSSLDGKKYEGIKTHTGISFCDISSLEGSQHFLQDTFTSEEQIIKEEIAYYDYGSLSAYKNVQNTSEKSIRSFLLDDK